jgi:transcriptional regulator with XRE-family HTH domain
LGEQFSHDLEDIKIILINQGPNYMMVFPAKVCESPHMSDESHPFEDIGKRLALARRALGLSGVELSQKLGVSNGVWSNWELGINQIRPEFVRKLKNLIPGLSHDWLYDGDRQRLTVELAELFDRLASQPEDGPKRRGRPSRH